MHRSRILALAALLPAWPLGAGVGAELLPKAEALSHSHTAESPPPPEPSSAIVAASPFEALGKLLGGGDEQEFLPPDAAFMFSVMPEAASMLSARWQIADGYYLYRDKIRFALRDAKDVALGLVSLPEGDLKEDEFFGRVQIYTKDIQVALPLARTGSGARTITLEAQYQGCAEAGICYPPITKTLSLELPPADAEAAS